MLSTSVRSILNLSPQQVEHFTERLVPQENAQGAWGCSSLTGFLAPGEKLLDCANRDRITLESRKITYFTIAERLENIFKMAVQAEAGQLVAGKFQVTIDGPTMCSQFCPFSPASDQNASPFSPIVGACGESRRDITIHNVVNDRTIKVSSLLPHLIAVHHFFEGQVPYRVDPIDLIETLEIEPDPHFTTAIGMPVTAVIDSQTEGASAPSVDWELTGLYPIASKNVPKQLAALYSKDLIEMGEGLVGVILPYPHGFDDQPFMGRTSRATNFLHIFNFGEAQKFTGSVNGAILTNISLPASKRVSIHHQHI